MHYDTDEFKIEGKTNFEVSRVMASHFNFRRNEVSTIVDLISLPDQQYFYTLAEDCTIKRWTTSPFQDTKTININFDEEKRL